MTESDDFRKVEGCLVAWARYYSTRERLGWQTSSFTYRMTQPRPETFGPKPEPEHEIEEYMESIIHELPKRLHELIELMYLKRMLDIEITRKLKICDKTLRNWRREAYAYILGRMMSRPAVFTFLI